MPTGEQRGDLESTLVAGGWPREGTRVDDQHFSPLVVRDRVRAFAPDEDHLVLYPPPLVTVSEDAARNPAYWDEVSVIDQIDPREAVLLGDFGTGSETVLIADYRTTPARVLRLVWAAEGQYWENVASSVDELIDLLGLADVG
ncbi:hypothetical protein [Nocardioides aestuarii]|uniref:SMI1/KNR4 family protein n=1 Tax=Nocardioides aestuarii TaxID=252231 RepID=A0ABW4THV3_9ACTN